MNEYYVYVYIDPRNLEEFYYGKGKGTRKDVHKIDIADSDKGKIIQAIKKEGLEPIIRVIASNLTGQEALLIEATLIWKLGKFTTNIAAGHFSSKFRPHNTLHKELSNFDYQNGIYYYNIGEGPNRNWNDYQNYGFISAGQGARWRDAMLGFQQGDVVAAYLKGMGFVGIGKIKEPAQPINNVKINNQSLLTLNLTCKDMGENSNSKEDSEYVAVVEWVKTVPRHQAKWKKNSGIYTTTHVRASLDGQPKTIDFLDVEFGINIHNLIT